MEQRLTLITLGVKNVAASTAFYEEKFGWSKSDESNEHISFFPLSGCQLALYERGELAEDATVPKEGGGFNAFTLAHNLLSKEAVDGLINELRQKRVTVIKAPTETAWGGYSGYVADLDGHLWEIAFNPFWV